MVHVGMAVRITTTQEMSIVPVDVTGIVVDLTVHDEDIRNASEHTGSLIHLKHLPKAIVVKLDNATKIFYPAQPAPCTK